MSGEAAPAHEGMQEHYLRRINELELQLEAMARSRQGADEVAAFRADRIFQLNNRIRDMEGTIREQLRIIGELGAALRGEPTNG